MSLTHRPIKPTFLTFVTALWLACPCPAWAGPPLVKPGDRIAWVGGTLVERAAEHATWDAALQCAAPDWRLTCRNLGWSGDTATGIARKRFDAPAEGYARLLSDLRQSQATVAVIWYGFSEAAQGSQAVDQFDQQLDQLVRDTADQDRRVVLVQPFLVPAIRVPGYADRIDRCRQIVADVAKRTGSAWIATPRELPPEDWSADGLVPNGNGYRSLGGILAAGLLDVAPQSIRPTDCISDGQLLAAIRAKDTLYFHHHRPQNETYLLLFRKHEQGNNAAELEAFLPLITAADARIWTHGRSQSPADR